MPDIPTHQCGHCGYDLSGLGDAGRCPECDQPFNRQTGYGIRAQDDPWARLEHREWLLRRVRTILLAVMAGFFLTCAGLTQWLVQKPRPAGIALVVGLVLVMAMVTSYVYEKD